MSLDFDLRDIKCLTLAIAGQNGKSTTASLLERVLLHNHRRTLVYGPDSINPIPFHGNDLDFLIVQVDAAALPEVKNFRPAVAVLLNAPPVATETGAGEQFIRAHAPLLQHQQFFDWAIVQYEALGRLSEFGIQIPGKLITFSATDPEADLTLDRGLLVSHLPNWPGPLLDLDHCLLRGPHNAENLLAALAVGHVLRLQLEAMADALKTFTPGSHRCELIAEFNGVQFINDSKAANLGAMEAALRTVRPGINGEPNVWLIAGGQDSEQDFHAAGPLISKRVKGAFVIGEMSQKIRLAWSLFTPCMPAASLLEAVAEAARNATSGDVVLLSPAGSGLDQFRNYQHRGQVFCDAVKSIGRGQLAPRPHMAGVSVPDWS